MEGSAVASALEPPRSAFGLRRDKPCGFGVDREPAISTSCGDRGVAGGERVTGRGSAKPKALKSRSAPVNDIAVKTKLLAATTPRAAPNEGRPGRPDRGVRT